MAGQTFIGHALSNVDPKGRLSVPAAFRQVIEARGGGRQITMSKSTDGLCIACYDRLFEETREADLQEQRSLELARGDNKSAVVRKRAIFSTTAKVSWDPSGRVILPDFLKDRARITTAGLFIGVGDSFEIWDLQTALEQPEDEDLRELAAFFIRKAAEA